MWNERRWLVPGMVASILLNVFLIGIVAGHVYGGRGRVIQRPIKGALLIRPARVRELPEAERKIYHAIMKPHRAAIVAAEAPVRVLRQRLETDIAAPTFDRAKIDADFAAFRQAAVKLQEQYNAAATDALAGLTQTSRAAIIGRGEAAAGTDTR